jgi:hypothetical protein
LPFGEVRRLDGGGRGGIEQTAQALAVEVAAVPDLAGLDVDDRVVGDAVDLGLGAGPQGGDGGKGAAEDGRGAAQGIGLLQGP